jgi:hypothetical protein
MINWERERLFSKENNRLRKQQKSSSMSKYSTTSKANTNDQKQSVMQDASVLGPNPGNKEYHVEKGGKVILVKRPNADNLPKEYQQPLKQAITNPVLPKNATTTARGAKSSMS